MICQKEFSIDVGIASCGIFNALVWGAPIIDPTASGTFIGPNVTMQASLFVPAAFSAYVECNGTVLYTGPEVQCNCRFIITDLTAECSLGILITHPLFPVYPGILAQDYEDGIDTPGTYDVSFIVPASVADTISVRVNALAGGGDFSGVTGSCATSIQL